MTCTRPEQEVPSPGRLADDSPVPIAAGVASARKRDSGPRFPPANPTLTYVAIGDSYSSGEGIGRYYESTNRRTNTGPDHPKNLCHRSRDAYPELVRDWLDTQGASVELRNVTCSGATTKEVLRRAQYQGQPVQATAFDDTVDLATIGVGGNDLGFGDALAACVNIKPVHPVAPCAAQGVGQVTERLPATIQGIQDVVVAARVYAPNARVLLVDYPILFELDEADPNCDHIRHADLEELISANTTLDQAVRDLGARNGVGVVTLGDVYADHGRCGQGETWINGLRAGIPAAHSQRDPAPVLVVPVRVLDGIRPAVPPAPAANPGTGPVGLQVRADLEPRVPRLHVPPEGRDVQRCMNRVPCADGGDALQLGSESSGRRRTGPDRDIC